MGVLEVSRATRCSSSFNTGSALPQIRPFKLIRSSLYLLKCVGVMCVSRLRLSLRSFLGAYLSSIPRRGSVTEALALAARSSRSNHG